MNECWGVLDFCEAGDFYKKLQITEREVCIEEKFVTSLRDVCTEEKLMTYKRACTTERSR